MDQKHLEVDEKLKKELIDFIVIESFKKANTLKDFPIMMQKSISERKHQLIINSSKSANIMMAGPSAEYPLVLDYDEKRGTLLKYNNRTISKYIENDIAKVSVKNLVTELRNKISPNTEEKKLIDRFRNDYAGISGNDAMIKAASTGDIEFIKYHFERGILTSHIFNDIIIEKASTGGHIDLVEYLIDRGAKVQRSIKYGTPEVQEWATQWKKEHPSKQRNFDVSWADFQNMQKNNPEWVKDISYKTVATIDNREFDPKNSKQDKAEVLYTIALIRNVAGEEAVENYKNKITNSNKKDNSLKF